jgi:tetratricopeptide (TPR) repeat protein
MTLRFLNRERGRRSLFVTLLLLIETFIFSPAVFSQQRFAQQTFMEALQTGNLTSFYDDTKMLAYARGITQAISDFLEENPESEKAGCANLGDPYQYASDVLQKDKNLDNATEFTADGRADLRLLIKSQNSRCDTPTMKAVAYNVWKLIAKPDQQKSAEQIREEQCVSYGRQLEEVNKSIRYQQWNPPPGLRSQKKLYEEKIREICPPSSAFRKSVPSAEVRHAQEEESRARQCRSYRESLEAQNTKMQRYSGNVPSFEQKLKARYEKGVSDFCSPSSAEQGSSPGTGGSQPDERAYEIIRAVTVRSGPGSRYEELDHLARGTKVTVAGWENGWLKIVSKHGKPPGYIPVGSAAQIPPSRPTETAPSSSPSSNSQPEEPQAEEATLTTEQRASSTGGKLRGLADYETIMPVTVRRGPGSQYEEQDRLSRGVKINAVESYEGWLKIFSKSGGSSGYIPLSSVRPVNPQPTETARPSFPPSAPQSEEQQAKKETSAAPAAAPPPPVAHRNQGVPYRHEPPPEQTQGQEQEQPKAPVSAPVLSGNSVQDCDAYAAHPDDPERNGARSVEDDSINAEKAIAVCKAAVEQNPQSGRLLFQLGRAYWAGERFEDAIEAFLEAGEQGHGGALAYLGDATLYGVAGMDADPEEAKKLYQRASAAGFKPAAALADEIVAGVKAVNLQGEQQAAGGEPNYHKPKAVKYLADGDWRGYDEMFVPGNGIVYTASIIRGVHYSCPEAIPAGTDLETLVLNEINRKMNFFEQDAFGTAYYDGRYVEIEQQGLDDGNAFAVVNGCQSAKTKTFVKTALKYF